MAHPAHEDAEAQPEVLQEPTARYGVVVEALRGLMPGSTVCKMFCNGSKCKHCDASGHDSNKKNVLRGVSSSWVNEDILAMSRPTQAAIHDLKLIDQLKQHNITFVVNLQEAFEHARCGAGVLDSGFSYDPEQLMQHGVSYGNFPWIDFGSPTKEYALDIVQVMAGVVGDGKRVAVHCHAGRGRTGLIIACYMIYHHKVSAASAIHLVRAKRAKTIQTRNQVKFVQSFAEWIDPSLRPLDNRLVEEASPLTLEQVLKHQQPYLYGDNHRKYHLVPELLCRCSDAIVTKLEASHAPSSLDLESPGFDVNDTMEKLTVIVNARQYDRLESFATDELSLFLLGWLRHLAKPAISTELQEDHRKLKQRRAILRPCAAIVDAAKKHLDADSSSELAARLAGALLQSQEHQSDVDLWTQTLEEAA